LGSAPHSTQKLAVTNKLPKGEGDNCEAKVLAMEEERWQKQQ